MLIDVLSDVWDAAIIGMLCEVFLTMSLGSDVVIDSLPSVMIEFGDYRGDCLG